MKANFHRCLAHVLAYEGGYSSIRSDPGNWTGGKVGVGTLKGTKYGISAAAFPNLDIKNLNQSQAGEIYRKKYWNVLGCDTLASGVDLAVMDFGVNSGVTRARTYLLKAIGGSDETTINRLCDARMAFLRGLKNWPTFGKGWTRRVEGVRKEALRMAGGSAVPANTESAPAKPAAPVNRDKLGKPAPKGLLGAFLAIIAAVVGVIGKKQGWW